MIEKLYADNYRCLVNFEISFDNLTLLTGTNGGGKSTLFDLLYKIRSLIIDNARISEIFPPCDMTAWVNSNRQVFELDVRGEDGLFSYRLAIEHAPDGKKQRIDIERLTLDGKPLFEFNQGCVKLYHDDHQPGPEYTFDWSASALATIVSRPDNKKLTKFKKWLEAMLIISLQPKSIKSESAEESEWLNRDGTNFASWYRYISQEHQDKIFILTEELRNVLPGFHAFKLEQAGRHRILKVGFVNEDQSAIYFDFEQISDGQRALIVLYSILLGLRELGYSIFLDEPENYIALPEIQPWLMDLRDACDDRKFSQALLISHHPELLDYLGSDCGLWLDREPLSPARVNRLMEHYEQKNPDKSLRLSEQIARGWQQ